MPNSIATSQNEPKQIIRLAAQRRLYSKAKVLFAVRTMISLVIAISGAVVASLHPNLRPCIALVALPYSFLDNLYFDLLQKRWTSTAAKIQEMFDTDILGLRRVDIKYGRLIDEEEVIELGEEAANDPKKSVSLRDWYPAVVQKLPLHLGRLICQRANSVWDKKLRQRYAEAVLILLILVVLVVFWIGLRGNSSFEQFILIVAVPLAPGLLLGLRHFHGLRESNKILEKISADVEHTWKQALQNPADEALITEAARDIQSQLFDHRKGGQVLFDWIYRILRSKSEQAMRMRADDLVNEAQGVLSKG